MDDEGYPKFNDKELEKLFNEYNAIYPLKKNAWLYGFLTIMLILLYLKGGEGFKSVLGIKYCSVIYWFSILLISGYGLAAFFHAKYIIQRNQRRL